VSKKPKEIEYFFVFSNESVQYIFHIVLKIGKKDGSNQGIMSTFADKYSNRNFITQI
jgi:hypothetical protein